MPITLTALQSSENQYVLAQASQLVGHAIAALKNARGNGWWHLVVELGAGRFGAIRFDDLAPHARSGGDAFFRQTLGDLVGDLIPVATTVDQNAVDDNAAIDQAYDCPGQLVVVTQGERCAGILHVGFIGSFEETGLLDLYDQFEAQNV